MMMMKKKITQQHSTLAGVYTVAVVDVDVVAFACVFTQKKIKCREIHTYLHVL